MIDQSEPQLHNVTAADHERITEAIRSVEKKTSGEVFAVVAHQSDDYFYVAGFFAGLWSLGLGLVIAVLAYLWPEILPGQLTITALAMAQVASFATSMAVFHFFPALRLVFVPRHIAYRRASNNAVRQFLAHGIHTTSGRSGVLLFMSLSEHYAEVVADSGISEKVSQQDWDTMVGTLTSHAARGQVADGFVKAIEQAGNLLATHFPPQSGKQNDLDDRLIEI